MNKSFKISNHLFKELLVLKNIILEGLLISIELLIFFVGLDFLASQVAKHEPYFHKPEDPFVHDHQHLVLFLIAIVELNVVELFLPLLLESIYLFVEFRQQYKKLLLIVKLLEIEIWFGSR